MYHASFRRGNGGDYAGSPWDSAHWRLRAIDNNWDVGLHGREAGPLEAGRWGLRRLAAATAGGSGWPVALRLRYGADPGGVRRLAELLHAAALDHP